MENKRFKGFNKVNKFADPELLEDSTLTLLENMIYDGKVKQRSGFARINSNSLTNAVMLKDISLNNSNYVLGTTATSLNTSPNGTGAWTNRKTLTSGAIRTAQYKDKIIMANDSDPLFYMDSDLSVTDLEIERPDISGMTHSQTIADPTGRDYLRDIFIYKAVTDGTYIYLVEENGTRVIKCNMNSDYISESEYEFTAIVSIAVSYDNSTVYVLHKLGTNYSLMELDADLSVVNEWAIGWDKNNATGYDELTDLHCTENKIWIGQGGIFPINSVEDAGFFKFIYNFDYPTSAISSVYGIDRSFCSQSDLNNNNISAGLKGRWVYDEGTIVLPNRLFCNSFNTDQVFVLFRVTDHLSATHNYISRVDWAVVPVMNEISRGIAVIGETTGGGGVAFTGFDAGETTAVSDLFVIDYAESGAGGGVMGMQLTYADDIAIIKYDIAHVNAVGITDEAACVVTYANRNTGDEAPQLDDYYIESYDYSAISSESYLLKFYSVSMTRLYFFHQETLGSFYWALSSRPGDPLRQLFTYGLGKIDTAYDYYYLLTYLTNTGEISQPSAIMLINLRELGDNTASFSNIPTSSDARVYKKRIYRTAKDGIAFYLITTLDNAVTTYTDETPDSELDTSTLLNEQLNIGVAKYPLIHKARLFLANISHSVNSVTTAPKAYTNWVTGVLGSGVMAAGNYKYFVTSIDREGKESPPSAIFTIAVTSADKVTLTINVPEDRFGYEIVSYKLYRTKTGGSVFYYRTTLTPTAGVLTFEDNVADSGLTVLYDPYTRFSSRINWSEIEDFANFNGSDYRDVDPNDSDVITGLVEEEDGVLIFKTHSIYKLITSSIYDVQIGQTTGWILRKIAKIGCDEPNSIVPANNKVYFNYNKQVYRYPDVMALPSSKIEALNYTTFRSASYEPYSKWYVLNADDTLYIYDEIFEIWYNFTFDTGTVDPTLIFTKIFGTTGLCLYYSGRLYRYDITDTMDDNTSGTQNVNIITKLRTKTEISPSPMEYIRLRQIHCNYIKKDSQTVTITIANPETAETLVITDTVNATNASDYKTLRTIIESMTGTMRYTDKYYIELQNIKEINGINVFFRYENFGTRG